MNLGKLGQALTAKEIFDLIHDDLQRVEQEISLESVASVGRGHRHRAVSAESSGGKRLRPTLLLLAAKLAGDGETPRPRSAWARSWR